MRDTEPRGDRTESHTVDDDLRKLIGRRVTAADAKRIADHIDADMRALVAEAEAALLARPAANPAAVSTSLAPDYAELERLARAASGVAWKRWSTSGDEPVTTWLLTEPDAAYIAVASPDVVLRLLARPVEPEPLDVLRLIQAYWTHRRVHLKLDAPCEWATHYPNCPTAIVREYARLSADGAE